MKYIALLLFAFNSLWVSAQTTVTGTRNDASQITGGSFNHRAGVNLVEILADSPFNKNILNGNSGDTGFEYQNAVQIWQTQASTAGCTLSTTQWQTCVNNSNFGPYTANQWQHADFVVIQGPDAGYVGTVSSNTASSPGTGGGAIFTVSPANSVAFQDGDVIKISTNCNMTNVCPTPSSQYTTNPYWGTWSVFNSATLGTDTTPADLCATCGKQSMKITFGATNSFATIAVQSGGGSLEKAAVMNGTYTASVWAKSSTGTATVSGSVSARSGSNCTMSNQTVATSWTQYSWTCNMTETTSGSGNAIFTFQVSAGGSTGTILFDNISFTNNADNNASQFTNKLVTALQDYAQKSQNTTGLAPTLRYAPDTSVTTIQNLLNNEMQQMPSPEGPQTNLTGGTYTKTKVSIPEFLQLCQVTGYIPEIILPITMTTSDAAYIADYLQGLSGNGTQGSIDRVAQGFTAPWVGTVANGAPFQTIYLEFGNENWNGGFIGETLGFRTSETGGTLGDYARWGGTIVSAFRAEQVTQSYTQSETYWVANAQTAANGSTMSDTASNMHPDLFEFDGYTSFGLDSVTSSSCANYSGTTCDLYMTSVSEAYLNVNDTASPHGFYQSLNTASGLNVCGPTHSAECRASVYEENVYVQASTSGPVTQTVSDSYVQTGNQGVMFARQILENATASFNGEGIEVQNLYHSNQFIQGEGGVNVHMWGGILDIGGDCSVTNSSNYPNYCPRPQFLGAEVANWAMLGHPVSCSQNSPTYTIPNMGTTNNNGLTIGKSVPYVTVYCFASTFPVIGGSTVLSEVFVNGDPSATYNVAIAGTNVPTTVTEYQYASPSLTSANELGGTTNISTNAINGTSSGIINSGPTTGVALSSVTAPPMSVTAVEWTAPNTSLVTVDFNSRSGGTVIANNPFGTNLTNVQAATPFNIFPEAGLNVVRLFVSENQLCPAGSCTGLSSSVLKSQLDLITAPKSNGTPILQVLFNFYQTDSSLQPGGGSTCSPPTSASTWATNIGTILSFVQSTYPTLTIAGVTLRNEPDTTSDWCPSSSTNLATYETFIGTAGPQLKTAFPSLSIGTPSLAAPAADASTWIPGVLGAWATPDFIDFHLYLGTQSSWANFWSAMQNASSGLGFYYNLVKGLAGTIPVWITETNNSSAFSADCCRNDATFGSLWNTLMMTDFLNPASYSSTTVPPHVLYYSDQSTASPNFFCVVGTPGTTNCDPTTLLPYPQYYAYQLASGLSLLNLQSGGHLANSISPGATTNSVNAAAWYTNSGDSILIVNPTSSAQTSQTITINNAGITNARGTQFLLNAANGTITGSGLALTPIAGGYTATVTVPAQSTLGILISSTTGTQINATFNATVQ